MSGYTQLTQEQRYQIYALMKAELNQSEIAMVLGVHKSTISRELRRNAGLKGYRPKQAHQTCIERRYSKAKPRVPEITWQLVESLLRQDWSPEQISNWLAKSSNLTVSHEWIYQYILADKYSGGILYKHLRCQKKRKKRYGQYSRRGQIPNQLSIDQRPAIVDSRSRYGDWEVDTVIGRNHKQALVTLVERKSSLTLISKVARKTTENVATTIIQLLKPFSS